MKTRGKSIQLFLMDGEASGRIKCTLANWTGVAFKIPRTELDKCKDRDDLKQSGVYFLFGTSDETGKGVVYIGQAGARKNGEGILNRLQEHKRNPEKDYWTEAIVFTTSNNSLGATEISYLENRFCNMALAANRYEVRNGNDPTPGNITEEKESTKALVTDISHQLKTPMAALKTCFYMYLDASDADEKTEFLKRSETQLEKLEQLIASLMNISRLETAMISLTKESILLSDLLVDAVNGVYEKARRKSIEISVQETENITLHLDKHWTSEAVINVLDNAVKYSPRNSHITISIEKQHFYTLVKIKDEGIGIPQNEYNKIFQRFYRSNHSYVKQTEGSGVGLYLTRMILERQGGLIRVESVPEKGSTFILQFRN